MQPRPQLRHVVAVPTGASRRPATDISGRDLAGRPRTVELTSKGGRTLLLFLGSRCDGCAPFWRAPFAPEACGLETPDGVAIVTRDPTEEDREALRAVVAEPSLRVAEQAGAGDLADVAAVLVMSGEAWRRYRVHGPPFFVLVEDGMVATEGVAWSVEQVAADVTRARSPEGEEAEGRPPARR